MIGALIMGWLLLFAFTGDSPGDTVWSGILYWMVLMAAAGAAAIVVIVRWASAWLRRARAAPLGQHRP
ncbi:hypothetical protein DSM112329_02827 [Paraconexibacter sp. AEG42_29]|uniref:Uncharacterized protein n=2 Tax=Paraconexibacter sp. AEG42_29 TaxID=2997339 RepID=A0AAU7AWE5_9ACTN